RVVNFVAQGTIEEGMLSVLSFKSKLFAGVLDGGEKDVFLGGSRLTKFMETVEKVTGAIPAVTVEEADAVAGAGAAEPRSGDSVNGHPSRRGGQKPSKAAPATAAESPAAPADPWTGLLQAGLALLQQVVGASKPEAAPKSKPDTAPSSPVPSLLTRD